MNTKSHHIFWPHSGNINVKCNVYFETSAQLEGKEENAPRASSEQATVPPTPSTLPEIDSPDNPDMPNLEEIPEEEEKEKEQPKSPPSQPCCSEHLRKPSRIMHDIQLGKGIIFACCGFPNVSIGLNTPAPTAEELKKARGVWVIIDDTPALLENFEGLENMFMAETADAEALEPWTLTEAKHHPDWLSWKKAVLEKLVTLEAAGTWMLEEPPPGANIIGSKWVFKAKKDTAGIIARFKARLVAQGFSQIDGIDYNDTYTPVARLTSFQAIISMANRLCLELHQVDIKGAYLNGKLNKNEVLYMHHPPWLQTT